MRNDICKRVGEIWDRERKRKIGMYDRGGGMNRGTER